MKARIIHELIAFLETSGITAKRLSQEAHVSEPLISRLKNGERKDVHSRHADALREAMTRLTATPTTPPEPEPREGGGDAA